MNKVSMPYIFSFPRYQTKYVMKNYFDIWWGHKIKQWLAGRKRGEDGNTKFWISPEQKNLFRWNKKHFA